MLGVQFPTGASCRIDVMFHPTSAGAKHATLHVRFGNVVDQTFAVRGTAIAAPQGLYATTPDIYVRPAAFQQLQQLMLVNAGTTSVDLGDPVINGPFRLSPPPGWNCPSTLTPGAACTVDSFSLGSTASGCPTGSLTTSTAALTVPLTSRQVP
jgi:hypothetical protein